MKNIEIKDETEQTKVIVANHRAYEIPADVANLIEILKEDVRAYGRHFNHCSQTPNGIDGDCTCGLLLTLERMELI